MRQDIKILLSRIGEESFNYYNFETPSLEIDVWPIFEALLLDERVVGRIETKTFARVIPAVGVSELEPHELAHARPAAIREPAPRDTAPGMFGSYGTAASAQRDESVRDVLARLASNAE